MSRLTGAVQLFPADLRADVASPSTLRVGSLGIADDGTEYRWCKAGGTALVPGKLQQAPAEDTAHQNVVTAAAAIGADTVTVTLGASAVTANRYAGGWLFITITPGQGYRYSIKSHPAADASATLVLTLEEPIVVALTTASNADLVANPYNGVIVNPTTATSAPVGAAIWAITAAQYGWIGVKGPHSCLVDDQTIVVGTNVAASNQAAGAVEPHTGVQALVGIALTGGATTDYVAVNINL